MYLSPPLDPLQVEALWHLSQIRKETRVQGLATSMTAILREALSDYVMRIENEPLPPGRKEVPHATKRRSR